MRKYYTQLLLFILLFDYMLQNPLYAVYKLFFNYFDTISLLFLLVLKVSFDAS